MFVPCSLPAQGNDTDDLQSGFNALFRTEYENHPELREVDGPSTSQGSVATSDSMTPQPPSLASGQTRIKLVSNATSHGASQSNGDGNFSQDDEDGEGR